MTNSLLRENKCHVEGKTIHLLSKKKKETEKRKKENS